MNNGQMDRGNENPTQHLPLWLRKSTKKTSVRLAGTGIWTRDLPNASLVRYHGATSLGNEYFFNHDLKANNNRPKTFVEVMEAFVSSDTPS